MPYGVLIVAQCLKGSVCIARISVAVRGEGASITAIGSLGISARFRADAPSRSISSVSGWLAAADVLLRQLACKFKSWLSRLRLSISRA
jgi:hypothetical protein